MSRSGAMLNALFMCGRDACPVTAVSYLAAMQHERDSGHHTVRLTEPEANAFRLIWQRQNRCWTCGGRGCDHDRAGRAPP
jgi:hypothetical protein